MLFKIIHELVAIPYQQYFEQPSRMIATTAQGPIAYSVMSLATDNCLTADPGVVSSILPGTIILWRLIMK